MPKIKKLPKRSHQLHHPPQKRKKRKRKRRKKRRKRIRNDHLLQSDSSSPKLNLKAKMHIFKSLIHIFLYK